jgi:response regulator of citrate/malate metabolism
MKKLKKLKKLENKTNMNIGSHCSRPAKKKNRGKVIKPEHIEAVKKWLPRGLANAVTMASLAKRMGCSKGAAERRFNAYLTQYGGLDQKIKFVPVREGERGPLSAGFYL